MLKNPGLLKSRIFLVENFNVKIDFFNIITL